MLRRLEVVLDWGTRKVPVGTLAENARRLYFEFASTFLENPLPISPFKLPVRPGLHEDKDRLKRMAFNVFAHNRDDHVKNFSFLMLPGGEWRLPPAYDLVYSEGINGWHTMDIAGEARKPATRHLLQVAAACDLKGTRAKELLERVREAVNAWRTFASETGVSNDRARQIAEALSRFTTQA